MNRIYLKRIMILACTFYSTAWSADEDLAALFKDLGYTVRIGQSQVTVRPIGEKTNSFEKMTCIHTSTKKKWILPVCAEKLLYYADYTIQKIYDTQRNTYITYITPPDLSKKSEHSDDELQFEME